MKGACVMSAYGNGGTNSIQIGMGSYPLQAAVSPNPPESASQIRDGLTQTEQIATTLHECINRLESRLETVLTPIPPSNQAGVAAGATPGYVGSHVFGRISQVNDTISAACKRLAELAQRIEV